MKLKHSCPSWAAHHPCVCRCPLAVQACCWSSEMAQSQRQLWQPSAQAARASWGLPGGQCLAANLPLRDRTLRLIGAEGSLVVPVESSGNLLGTARGAEEPSGTEGTGACCLPTAGSLGREGSWLIWRGARFGLARCAAGLHHALCTLHCLLGVVTQCGGGPSSSADFCLLARLHSKGSG